MTTYPPGIADPYPYAVRLTTALRQPRHALSCLVKTASYGECRRGSTASVSLQQVHSVTDVRGADSATVVSGYGQTRIRKRIVRLPVVERLTGLKSSSIYSRINPNSKYFDEHFPKPVKLAAATGATCRRKGAVGWIESEIEEWLTRVADDRSGIKG